MAQQLSTNNFGPAKWIVNPTAYLGTHTTIASAITSASSGDTIFIMPATYTENLTLKAGVNLVAYSGDEFTPNVTMNGKCTFTAAGTVSIGNIKLQTNSDFFLSVTGSSASIINLNNCYLNCLNNTGISFTTSSPSAQVNITDCLADLGTTGISLFADSSAGTMLFLNGNFTNTGGSSTANTCSAGNLNCGYATFSNPITTSGTSALVLNFCGISTVAQNVTALTVGGSGGGRVGPCIFNCGTDPAISIGSSLTMSQCEIVCSNTNAITGAGALTYTALNFSGTSSGVNTTTQILRNIGPNVSVGSGNSGGTNTLTVTNSSNTSSSSANIVSTVAGSSAADPTYQAVVSGVTSWTWGADNSVTSPTADPWVLAQGTTLGTNNVMSVDTAGAINYPLQPAFLATSNTQSNVTGDGTVYTILYDNTIFDQGTNFSSPTFTAPVTGRYQINVTTQSFNYTVAHTASNVIIVASNRSVTINGGNFFNQASPAAILKVSGSILIDMDAADTCSVTLTVSNGTKVIGINPTQTTFSGFLMS